MTDILNNEGGIFKDARAAVYWALSHNPARAKSINIIEPNHGDACSNTLNGFHPDDVFAAVITAIKVVLSDLDNDNAKRAFLYCDLGRPWGERIHPDVAAKLLHTHVRSVYKWRRNIWEELERLLHVYEVI